MEIHLLFMVKNSGAQFEETLRLNKPYMDRWTILDTGSTDDTVDVVNRVLHDVPGALHQEQFVNFRDSRNRLIELAGTKSTFTIMLDDTYVINGDLRSFLNKHKDDQSIDSFSMYIKSDDVVYCSNRILRPEKGLKYMYKIHEVVEPNYTVVVPLEVAFIVDRRFDYMEQRTMERKTSDLQMLFEELQDDPTNPRTYYYLGQTYNLLKDYEHAFFYFIERTKMDGFLQEKVDACFEAARLANFQLGKPWTECEKLYLQAYAMDESRPDSLYFIGMHYWIADDKLTAFHYMKLAFEKGFPVHAQYSLKPTLSYYFLPKFLTQMCYEFEDFSLGLKSSDLFLANNSPGVEYYDVMVSWRNIFAKLVDKPTLCFVADGGFAQWTGADILTKGVGGAETYIIEMARHFQRSKYNVTVFCNCPNESVFENVIYKPLVYFDKQSAFDVCVVSRFSEYLPLAFASRVKSVYFVLHDLTPSGLVVPIHPKLKRVFCLSEWHTTFFTDLYPQLKHLTTHLYYGVNNAMKPLEKTTNMFIYSSFPNRGLLPLLKMWREIVDRFPDATLHICADVDGAWVNSVEQEMMREIRGLLEWKGVVYRGWLSKQELADVFSRAEYWLYPCTFKETFCLTALEAAISKTLCITNGLAALQNTVGDRGVLIKDDDWKTVLFQIMENPAERRRLTELNYAWASKLTWESQADKLYQMLNE